MKKILLYMLICATVLMAGCNSESTDNAQIETDINPVIPKINGTVTRILAEDNQRVKEGDTLIMIDDANYRIAVEQAEIAVLSAKKNYALAGSNKAVLGANVNTAKAGESAVAANLDAAKAGVKAARVKYEVSDKNYLRFKTLLEQKSVTQQQFDGVKAERDANEQLLKIAEGQLEALKKQIEASQAQVSSTAANQSPLTEGVGLAELGIKQAEANLQAARLVLSYCTITAPCNGVVSKKNVQKGQVVGTGQPLMAIANTEKTWIVANFKETQIEKMKVGQEATIKVDAYGSKSFKGVVQSFAQATGAKFSLLPADNATGNFVKVTQRIPVKITLSEISTEYPLRAGMSVTVDVKTK